MLMQSTETFMLKGVDQKNLTKEEQIALKTTQQFLNLDKTEQLKLLKDPTK